MSDPRYTDPRLSDPVLRRDEGLGGTWGWIAGVAVLLLIGFLIIAGGNGIGISRKQRAVACRHRDARRIPQRHRRPPARAPCRRGR